MISTHILDTTKGAPASGVTVVLERKSPRAGERLESIKQMPTEESFLIALKK